MDDPSANECGQSLVEFVLIVPILTFAIVGAVWLLRETTRRTECSRRVFEAVRSELEGGFAYDFRGRGGLIRKKSEGVEGKLRCGTHTEFLFLPKLGLRKPGA